MKKIKRLLKGRFIKNVLLITGSTAFAQGINTLLSPIITRIYPPEQYGVLTFFTSLLTIIAIIASLKYEMGIPIAENDKKAINILSLSIIILFIVTIFIAVALYFIGDMILVLLKGEILIKYKYLIPLGLFFIGLYNILSQWAFRRQDYKSLAKTKISQSAIQNLLNISFGLLKLGPLGLILGRIFGQAAGITTLSLPFLKRERKLLREIDVKSILWVAKRYINFPVYSAPGQFLNILGLQLPVLFMTSLYGSNVVGLYGLANNIVNIPMNLIGNSIADVFYGEAAKLGKSDPQKLKTLSNKLLKKSAILGLIPLIILSLFGPILFSLVFGENWREAGIYAGIISFLVFSRLIFTPISRIFFVYEKQKESLLLDLLRAVLVIIVFGISKLLNLIPYVSLALYVLAMSLVYLITYLYAKKVLNDEIKNYI